MMAGNIRQNHILGWENITENYALIMQAEDFHALGFKLVEISQIF